MGKVVSYFVAIKQFHVAFIKKAQNIWFEVYLLCHII